jgi:D-alanyl-lipoteichoic acid acyltransferase DltB (MBOAT superfamily)
MNKAAISALSSDQPLIERIGIAGLIVLIYPVYLYFNFSGYIDAVIGVVRLFRNELPENFNRPVSSENFIDFWSRWHITLSTWLKPTCIIRCLCF